MSRSLLGGRDHQITHANVDIELNGVYNTRENKPEICHYDRLCIRSILFKQVFDCRPPVLASIPVRNRQGLIAKSPYS